MDTVRRSVGGAMLTESQQHSLDTLRAEAEQLARFGRRDEALRTLRLAMSIIAAGPPALE